MATAVPLSYPKSREDLQSASKSLSISLSASKDLNAAKTQFVSPPPLYSADEKELAKSYASLSLAIKSNAGSGGNREDAELQELIAQDLDVGFKFFSERLKVNLSSCKVNQISTYMLFLFARK
jgi:hypothetical protein